jgi:NAD(P)-dependent dehydrogenase (short-subunit alcohol dehydrogenase family)
MHFQGKVAIVTGGSSGIGKEAAKRLIAHGASVVLGGKDEAKLRAAAKEISEEPSRVRILAGDIGKPATGAALVDFAEKEFGGAGHSDKQRRDLQADTVLRRDGRAV